MKQLHLDPEVNAADRREELRREIRALASFLGWTPADLDQFCQELFGSPLLLCEPAVLDWLVAKFRDVSSAVKGIPE